MNQLRIILPGAGALVLGTLAFTTFSEMLIGTEGFRSVIGVLVLLALVGGTWSLLQRSLQALDELLRIDEDKKP